MKDRSSSLAPHRWSPSLLIPSGKPLRAALLQIIGLFFLVFAVTAPTAATAAPSLERKANQILDTMSLGQKIGQLFMVPVDGSRELSKAETAFLGQAQPGAVILFGFNLLDGNRSARAFTASIQDALAACPLPALVAVDHEGGSVFRFKGSLTFLPSASEQGSRLESAKIEELAGISGAQLRALGISVNLAPIVEPLRPWNSGFLGDRAYSDDPVKAAKYAAAFARGMRASGIAATLKHFPGNAADDPHKGLPVLALDDGDLKRYALSPFKRALKSSKADIVMLSHAKVPAMDPDMPASLSAAAVDCLRRELGFKGVVLTDDLEMGALSADRPVRESALLAFKAGADMLMLSTRSGFPGAREELLEAVESGEIGMKRLDESVRRIIRLKLTLRLMDERDPAARQAGLDLLPGLLEEGRKFINDRFR